MSPFFRHLLDRHFLDDKIRDVLFIRESALSSAGEDKGGVSGKGPSDWANSGIEDQSANVLAIKLKLLSNQIWVASENLEGSMKIDEDENKVLNFQRSL